MTTMTLEVILKKDVADLGEEGDICRVARGYARNYLLPFGLVVVKTPKNLDILRKERDQIEAKKREKLEKFRDIAQAIEELQLEFWLRASKTGKLFGSISTNNLHQELEAKGFSQIKKNQIQLAQPIKSLGEYSIPIKIYGNLMANLKIRLQDQSEKEEKAIEEDKNTKKEFKPSINQSGGAETLKEKAIEEKAIEEKAIKEEAGEAIEEKTIEEKTIEEKAIEEKAIEEKAIEETVGEEVREKKAEETIEEAVGKTVLERSEENRATKTEEAEDSEEIQNS